MMSGNVIAATIGQKGDSTDKTIILEVMFSDPDDVKLVEWLPSPGEDSTPQIGSRVIVHRLASGYLIATGGNDGALPVSTAGGKETYSTNPSHTKMARIVLSPDGTIELKNTSTSSIKLLPTGNILIVGNLDVTGIISATGDVIAASAGTPITSLTHVHGGVTVGAGVTGVGI